ncbi:Uncharacterized protein conserved in bacteria [Aedoeadaptatus ivorii]|uniref:Uncharacterized protein conserved in bacteria n=1 Tax=Aedoeadaptatus ivorii TaxID=54006 RepID=A0A3S5C2X5_9FIRM|nr:cyclic-di-AMP receptor [Peptoniphilus ivorii]VEJ36311.1 Uncharacterized protein conserved in bacteria [Peptoniphilus ivorii]
MKLIFAIVQDQDASGLIDVLTEKRFRVTKLSSSGGFLKSGNTTLLMGVEEEDMDELLTILEENCSVRDEPASMVAMTAPGESFLPYPLNVRVGGATIFILDVAEYSRY